MFATETKTVRLYSYDEQGIYCGSFDYVWVEGTGLAANSTRIEPFEQREGFAIVWNSKAWEYQEDHTGKAIYSIADGSSKTIKDIGPVEAGYTLLKPNTQFDTWNGEAWEDQRAPQEIAQHTRSLLPKLSKRQFALYLYDNEMYDEVMQAINANPRFKIEYDSVSDIERLSPTVSDMSQLLGWTDEQIDQMWQEALLL